MEIQLENTGTREKSPWGSNSSEAQGYHLKCCLLRYTFGCTSTDVWQLLFLGVYSPYTTALLKQILKSVCSWQLPHAQQRQQR